MPGNPLRPPRNGLAPAGDVASLLAFQSSCQLTADHGGSRTPSCSAHALVRRSLPRCRRGPMRLAATCQWTSPVNKNCHCRMQLASSRTDHIHFPSSLVKSHTPLTCARRNDSLPCTAPPWQHGRAPRPSVAGRDTSQPVTVMPARNRPEEGAGRGAGLCRAAAPSSYMFTLCKCNHREAGRPAPKRV